MECASIEYVKYSLTGCDLLPSSLLSVSLVIDTKKDLWNDVCDRCM